MEMTPPPWIIFVAPLEAGTEDCACAAAVGSHSPEADDADDADAYDADADDADADDAAADDLVLVRSDQLISVAVDAEHSLFLHQTRPGALLLESPAVRILNTFARPRPLAALQELQDLPAAPRRQAACFLIQAGLLHPAAAPQARLPRSHSDRLVAWLHLTDRCNLRCRYCYLEHRPQNLSLENGQAALQAVFRAARAHAYRRIQIKYAGGEPLLRPELLRHLCHLANELAQRQALALDEVLLTNGTLLTPLLADEFKARRLRLMISLDGLDPRPGYQRSYAGGRSALAATLRGIELACRAGLAPHISVTVTPHSAAGLPELVDWLLERGLSFHLNFCRPAHDSLPAGAGMDDDLEPMLDGLLAAFARLEARPPRRSLLALLDHANLSVPHLQACGAGRDYLVCAPLGRVARCHMRLGESWASVHDADPLAGVRRPDGPPNGLQAPSAMRRGACAACIWRFFCAGGCPLAAFRSSGRYDAPSPFCSLYRRLYPALLRLEGKRLLAFK